MTTATTGPEQHLNLVCDSDVHDIPAPIVRFERTSEERWTFTMTNRRGTGSPYTMRRPREHYAATGTLAQPWDTKTTLRCPECGDNLEVGAGKWERFEAALDGIATVLAGQPATLRLVRGAYKRAA